MPKTKPQAHQACATCDDLGVVLAKHGDGHMTIPCPGKCDAGLERQRAIYRKTAAESEIPPFYADMTFESFQTALKGQPISGKLMGYAVATTFAEKRGQAFRLSEAMTAHDLNYTPIVDYPSPGLVLTGDVGMGKTGLAVAAANELMSQGIPVLYYRVTDLIDSLQATYSRGYQGTPLDKKLYTLITVPVLILDEFELHAYTENRLELIERIIRGRNGQGLGVLATTNIPDKDTFTALWDRRIGDIVATYHWVAVSGYKMRQTDAGIAGL